MKWNFETVEKPEWFIESEKNKDPIYFKEMIFWIFLSHFLIGIIK